ncbi:probable serine/threonine-protein kinase PBL7 [Papaver somniferum]|uniref:probable serine/threonine-protein kinase PBL7 n=1 Tax=Papaver somniferum TaxID=3469 RepID=UPI000E6FABBE|nr:probable serine/threonine-protein kinase PBL7 [Papaver somniferum]XP_026438145.1 probable serine/threonine-protein kinase PBL7 [Papaver somniferum]XP_026438146.1 probable serine/threonine-protein kinase PBL7 [Papaver somniferum]XP_026438147.1 probable serine/threonine-protein kinase PBL7 [Papaver somniferum]
MMKGTFIVYEFMPLRSLDLYLYEHEINKEPLDWKTRMEIAEGVAKALLYLHDQNEPPVIYVDLKTSGILLDEKFNPKLSDFGFAKLGPTWDCREAPIKLMETIGYAPPEYFMTGKLTLRHVVYSFGVVLLELVAGRKAIQENLPFLEQSIVAWAGPLLVSKKFTEIADPVLGGRYPEHELAQALTVAENVYPRKCYQKTSYSTNCDCSFRYTLRS